MAAKPPKPPAGNFLRNTENNQENTKKNSSSNTLQTTNCNNSNNNNNNNNNNNTITNSNSKQLDEIGKKLPTASNTTTAAAQNNCNCTNISIMHLFHEMKQEFPTIPDTIVAQCVNENCHQRENCLQMLRNELELNPIPVQSYPAKVLHPHITAAQAPPQSPQQQSKFQHQNSVGALNSCNNKTLPRNPTPAQSQKPPLQQKPIIQQHKPSLPLKPIRTAPSPPVQVQQQEQHTPAPPLPTRKLNFLENSKALKSGDVVAAAAPATPTAADVMPTKTLAKIPPPPLELNIKQNHMNTERTEYNESKENNCQQQPRARPTTLNLNEEQQKQRKLLNIQLQQQFQQQRNKQTTQSQNNKINLPPTKPIRRAPLPPIAPKPNTQQFHQSCETLAQHHNNGSRTPSSPLSSATASESEISVNVSLSTTPSSPTGQSQKSSTIRHRSVITLQPEPPYTRDFLAHAGGNSAATTTPAITLSSNNNSNNTSNSSTAASTPTSGCSQKSFTSLNLTLRPPATALNSPLAPATIDISAGPGFTTANPGAATAAGTGGGSLRYSSTSYDARRGLHQNFHITVTDEGSVFHASRIRPQMQQRPTNVSESQYEGNNGGSGGANVTKLSNLTEQQQYTMKEQQQQQQQQYLLQQQQLLSQGYSQTYSGGSSSSDADTVCSQQQALDAFAAEKMKRQKERRDKLANALRENKKRLYQVEQEVNLICGPIPLGLCERLDMEIQKLRAECQAMLRSSYGNNAIALQQQQQQQQQHKYQQQLQQQYFYQQQQQQQQQTQSFPGQMSNVTAPARPLQRYHSSISAPVTSSSISPTTYTQQQFYRQQISSPAALRTTTTSSATSTPTSASSASTTGNSLSITQQPQQQQQQQQQYLGNHPYYTDSEEEDDNVLGGQDDAEDDDYYEVLEPWECSMCTFENNAQLNSCEICECVRVLPGMLSNSSSSNQLRRDSSVSATSAATNSLNALAAASASVGMLGVVSNPVINPITNSNNNNNSAGNSSGNITNNSSNNNNTSLEHDGNLAQQQLQHLALHT